MIKNIFTNKAIAQLLRNIAAAYLLTGGNRFKIIAYEKAADAVEHLSREIYDIWQEGKLQQVAGIGPGIGSGLAQYFDKGESNHFNEILKNIPPSVFVLMDVPGIGPKRAFKLVVHFGLTHPKTVVSKLKKIAQAGQIAVLPGFGKKSEQDILEALELYERHDRREERMSLPRALEIAQEITNYLKQHKLITQVDVLGSLRRKVSTIGDIDIAVQLKELSYSKRGYPENRDSPYKKIIKHFLKYPGKRSVEAAGEQKASILAAGNIRIDLRVQSSKTYGSMLQYFTGSKAHNIMLREYALSKGYSLSEHGIKETKKHPLSRRIVGIPPSRGEQRKSSLEVETVRNFPLEGSTPKSSQTRRMGGGVWHSFENEKDLYSFLGLQTPPPELREGTAELELAKKHKLPSLIRHSDICGDFHMHTSYDLKPSHDLGRNTYQEMMEKAQSLAYQYVGFSEHNPKQKGLSDEEIITIMKARKCHIDTIFSSSKTPYFIGLEVDILPNGALALPSGAIAYVDYLIASLHSSFAMNRKDMTARVLRALSYPKVKIFGHPTARLLGKRDGVELDWDAIFSYVIDRHIALEINSAPMRLDLPDILVKEGKEHGARFIINTDAHAVEHMDFMPYGISVARRGWLTKSDVVNTWSLSKMREWMFDKA